MERLSLVGPSKIGYFVSKKYNKKIIILGDIHGSKDGDHDGTNIVDYIDSLSSTNYAIDIFVETNIPNFLSNPTDKKFTFLKNNIITSNDFISDLTALAFDSYKQQVNKRYHFTDVRNDIYGHESFVNAFNVIMIIRNCNVVQNLLAPYASSLLKILKWVQQPSNETPFYFLKEGLLLSTKNPIVFQSMTQRLEKYIDNFLKLFFKTLENNVDCMYNLGQIAGASITDFYTLARIMKSNEYENCIVYTGLEHYSILKSYLHDVDFVCIDEISSTISNERTVKNALDFLDFFQMFNHEGG